MHLLQRKAIDTLNERIHCFPYAHEEIANKPSQVVLSSTQSSFHPSGKCLKYNLSFCDSSYIAAAQMWTLSIYLPLIIGDKVPYNKSLWKCFLLLLDILQIVMGHVLSWFSSLLSRPHIRPSQYVSSLLSFDYHYTENALHGSSSIPNSQVSCTFLENSTAIQNGRYCRLGPLVTSWYMRMETKNSYFKKIAQTSNFKNIAYSVAKRHQRLMCAYLQ